MTMTWQDFEAIEVQTADTSIFLRRFGSGPGVLLLHGFPQTHLMWRDVAPLLAQQFTVICADLRGYGRSCCPPSKSDHRPWRANSTPERAAVLQPFKRSGRGRLKRFERRVARIAPRDQAWLVVRPPDKNSAGQCVVCYKPQHRVCNPFHRRQPARYPLQRSLIGRQKLPVSAHVWRCDPVRNDAVDADVVIGPKWAEQGG